MNATPPVRYLVLWLTTGCNLRCAYCYRGDQPGQTMSLEVARTALNLAAASGLPFHVQLAGGEPTLEPDLMEAIGRIIRQAGWSATLAVQTNGTLIDKHLVDVCRRASIAFGISLDGPPEVHERIRGSAAATFRGLALLDRARIPVHVTAVLSALNVMHTDRLILSLACLANVQGVALDPIVLKGNALLPDKRRSDVGIQAPAANAMIPAEREVRAGMHAMLTTLQEINRMRSHPIRWRELDAVTKALNGEAKQKSYCHACKGESLAVHPDGTVYPCGQTVGDSAMAAGTVDRVNWERLRGMFRDTRLRGDCLECPLQNCCPGDCPSRIHYNETCLPTHCMCLIYRTIADSLERKDQS